MATGAPAVGRVTIAPAVPRGALAAGPVPAAAAATGAVVLEPRDAGALKTFIARVTEVGAPQFHRYLAPGQFASTFGPEPATIAAVRATLQSDGLTVAGVSNDGLLVRFSGTAAAVQSAFHTTLERYRLADGTTGRQATSALALPAAIAPSVAGVVGLDTLVGDHAQRVLFGSAAQRAGHATAASSAFAHPAGAPAPCADARAAAVAGGGLTDDQIANAYGAFGLYGAGDRGAGQRIAIYEQEPFLRSDVATFDACYFGSAAASAMLGRLHVIAVDGGQPTGAGSGEANLDVEDISAMAPGATIDVYEGPLVGVNANVYDSLDMYTTMIDADRDQIISTSWGLCEQSVQEGQPGLQAAENLLFQQAAAQGQTVFSAAGDNGSDDCNTEETSTPVAGQDPVSVDDPSSQPYVVAVGGSSIDDATSQPPVEQVWNDGSTGGAGGGGISASWPMPAWQESARVPGMDLPGSADYANADAVQTQFGYPDGFCAGAPSGGPGTPCRLLPDVSAQADEYTGSVTVYSASYAGPSTPTGWVTTGGTSSAAPIWAAMLADVNASPACAANPVTAHGVGFADPLLYAVASDPAAYTASFHDITTGNNDIYGLDDGLVFPARTGYDLASGLGSPRLTGPGDTAGLAYYLCRLAAAPARPAVSAIAPVRGSIAGGEQVTISGRGFEAGGQPDVTGIQVGSDALPAGEFRVASDSTIRATLPPARATLPPSAPAPQNGAGPANVVVTLSDGQSSAIGPAARFQYVDTAHGTTPTVTGISPYGGAAAAPAPLTILGFGLSGATAVTFGGVAADSVRVLNADELSVTPPAESPATRCAPLPSGGVYTGETAANDICQVTVRVATKRATSAAARILAPLEGAITTNVLGDEVLPPGCGCEQMPAPTEYDYLPAPAITSISTAGGAADLASENGSTVITVHGRGLDPLGLEWTDFGPAGQYASQDFDVVDASGTELQVVAPAEPLTVDPANIAFSVRTVAGQSAPVASRFAGVPTVTGVSTPDTATRLGGLSGAPDTGMTPIAITGSGFAGQLTGPITFTDSSGSGLSNGTQYTYTVHGDTVHGDTLIDTETVEQDPALVDVQACTVTGCSATSTADQLYLYPPGAPSADSVTPASGPATGATPTTITGANLGCPLAVRFGSRAAESFSPAQAMLDCGSTVQLAATSPPGSAGTTVPVTVQTVESYFAGTGFGRSTADFTYTGAG